MTESQDRSVSFIKHNSSPLWRKLNVKSAAMAVASVLVIAGCVMIFMGIRDFGVIDVKAPFLTGQVKSGFVGVLLVFAGLVLSVSCLVVSASAWSRKRFYQVHTVRIRRGDGEVELTGPLYMGEDPHNVEVLLKAACEATETPIGNSAQASEIETRDRDTDQLT